MAVVLSWYKNAVIYHQKIIGNR